MQSAARQIQHFFPKVMTETQTLLFTAGFEQMTL